MASASLPPPVLAEYGFQFPSDRERRLEADVPVARDLDQHRTDPEQLTVARTALQMHAQLPGPGSSADRSEQFGAFHERRPWFLALSRQGMVANASSSGGAS